MHVPSSPRNRNAGPGSRVNAAASALFTADLPYPSRRSPIYARQAVATSHPLAAQAGLAVLERGGCAVDAAIAAAATLTVVEPTMNGLGGDLFALVWDGARLHGLNASGRAPLAWTRERFGRRRTMPTLGWDSVTVPGLVSGWAALSERFGRLPFESLLGAAIGYGYEGFLVTPHVAALWAEAPDRFRGFREFERTFLPHGRAPKAGDHVSFRELARTLEAVAESRGRAFYSGEIAKRIVAAAREEGGALSQEDLARHQPTWVEPLGVDCLDARVHELPPNGQGLVALVALGILEHLPVGREGPDHPETVHLQIEAMKIAFAECRYHLADPSRMRVDAAELLSPDRLAVHAKGIDLERASEPRPFPPPDHGTVYVSAADREGGMVSLIQSNYMGFGSGIVVPKTGISMQNRGLGFSLDPAHPNCVAGGARPYHTIMPGLVTRGDTAAMSFGVMGGHMQPQGHVQVVLRVVHYRQNPQAACDAPRWHVTERSHVALEPGFAPGVAKDLARRGHRLLRRAPSSLFGGAQIIHKVAHGYCAGSDPRKDGQAVGS
jgi:gamma-glutamyltranspeptidase / glutathione hydrolase